MASIAESPFDVRDRVFLVAGAAGGIVSALIDALAAGGAHLVLSDKDVDSLTRLSAAYSCARSIRADITDAKELDAAVSYTREEFGRIDGGVNATGVLAIGPSETMDPDTFRRCVDINLTGAFLFSRALSTALKCGGGGRLLHIASVSSIVANPGYAAYAGSKAGLAQMVRVLAREWAPFGVTVNAIAPAMTDTPLTRAYISDPSVLRRTISDIPMGRLGTAEDIVGAGLLLLGPGGSFITGQTLCVDGGRTLV